MSTARQSRNQKDRRKTESWQDKNMQRKEKPEPMRKILSGHDSVVKSSCGPADYRKRIGTYPLGSLLALYLLAVLCGAPRGSKDLAKFARKLSQGATACFRHSPAPGALPGPQPAYLLAPAGGNQWDPSRAGPATSSRAAARPGSPRRVDCYGWQGAQSWRRSQRAHRPLRAQPVLLGQRGGRHQDQRDPRGAKTLSRPGLERPFRLAGCPAHTNR